jgi:hypothetical protein
MSVNIVGGEIVRKGMEDLSRSIPLIGRQQIYFAVLHARTRLRKSAARPGHPIHWDSVRQRKAYFASDGFGRGIPTRRTGRYEQGWTIVKQANGYSLENNTEGAQYIGGDFSGAWQSRIHQSRWPIANEVLADEIDTLPSDIENNISSEARRIFG